MERKKSHQADLEGHRFTYFLLGMVFVLSLGYVAMAYRSVPMDFDMDSDFVEELAQDLSLRPDAERELVQLQAKATEPVVSTVIKAVDRPVEKVAELPERSHLVIEGDGEAELMDAKIVEQLENQLVEPKPEDPDMLVDKLPEYPGGWVEFMQWLTKQLRYPPQAQKAKVQGRVVVSFLVGADGKISDVKLAKSVHPQLDKEALRVINMMPDWKPGTEKGKPCQSMVVVPVVFKL